MKNLLLISCSQRKVETPAEIPAIDRYDGPVYRCLRKFVREGRFPEDDIGVLIVSAKYGLITPQTCIENYDQRMTSERAQDLLIGVQKGIEWYMHPTQGWHDQVFINLGKLYMETLEGFNWGLHSTLEASGGIGQRTSHMKHWIEQIINPPPNKEERAFPPR